MPDICYRSALVKLDAVLFACIESTIDVSQTWARHLAANFNYINYGKTQFIGKKVAALYLEQAKNASFSIFSFAWDSMVLGTND